MLSQASISKAFVQPLCSRVRIGRPRVVARAGEDVKDGRGNNVSGEYCSISVDGKKADDRSLMEKETDFLEVRTQTRCCDNYVHTTR